MGICCNVCCIANWSHGCCNDDLEKKGDMKSRTFFLALIFILLYGCISNPNASQPATSTPEGMARLNPSPTDSNNTLPLTCQVTDLNVYINAANGYCLAY